MKILADCCMIVCNKENVINCFKKARSNSDVQQVAMADSDNPFKGLKENLNKLKSADPSMAPKNVTGGSIISFDDNAIATASQIAESNIIERLCFSQQTEVEKEENKDGDKNSIEELFDQSQEKTSRSKLSLPFVL